MVEMKNMMKRPIALALIGAVVAGLAFGPVLHARADSKMNPVSINAAKKSNLLEVTLGKGEVLTIPGDVADVLVADPSIADVSALQADKLYVVGSRLGNTNLMVLDAQGNVLKRVDVHVKIDEAAIQAYLKELYPNENVSVRAVNGRFFLTGNVSTPDASNKIANVVAAYFNQGGGAPNMDSIVNLLQVAGEQQVMLRVKIMEVSKSLLRELGIDTQLDDTSLLGNNDNLIGAIDTIAGTGLTQNPFATGSLIFDDGSFGPLSFMLSALENDQMAQTLAEPNLTAISGEQAGFLAGGEFPVPAGRDNDGNVIIEYRSFGVSLNFRPVVLSSDRISLQMNTEVSSISRDNSVTLNGLDVPGLSIRRASTTVEMGSGGSLMIAGLLQSNALKGMAGLPGIQQTPVLGDLISSESFNRQESELVIIVTPVLVKPYAETKAARKVQAPAQTPLREAFINNIRRIYGRKAPASLSDDGSFGYILN